jgi:hypothetical protein
LQIAEQNDLSHLHHLQTSCSLIDDVASVSQINFRFVFFCLSFPHGHGGNPVNYYPGCRSATA